MKVAIIGAGISGLSSAIEFKKHGITPVIFEKSHSLGDRPEILVALLRLFCNSLNTPMSYISKKCGIDISPLHPVKKIVMNTQKKTVSIKGNQGYVFKKGIDAGSLEHQLFGQCNVPVEFDTYVKLEDIKNDFDHIIVATGKNTIVKKMNLWTTTLAAKIRIATVTGSFEQNTIEMWLNKRYTKDGYSYIIPSNGNEAEISLIVTDITMDKLDYYWNEFVTCENLRYNILKSTDIEHISGYPSVNHVDNIYFTGSCGGMMDDFLGFGVMKAIESGVLAARAIIYGKDYDSMLEPFKNEIKALYEYRKAMNVIDNDDYDKILPLIGLPVLKNILYNNPVYKTKHGIFAPKAVTFFKKKYYMFSLRQR